MAVKMTVSRFIMIKRGTVFLFGKPLTYRAIYAIIILSYLSCIFGNTANPQII